jgi:hypothetical protein
MASEKNSVGRPVLPKALDEIVDKVLAYKPPPRSKAAKKRAVEKMKFVTQPEHKKAAD